MRWLRPLLLLLLLTPALAAADWPQWLGPRRDGSSPEKVKPWKGDLKVLWRQPVGPGHSSPVVAGGKVFLHAQVKGKDEEEVVAYDAKTGKRLWGTSYPRVAFSNKFGTGPRATPAVADGKVYSYGVTGVLACFDAAKGKLLWQVDTLKEFKSKNLFFGMACSPLVDGGKVLVNVGGEGASVVAFSADKGQVVWKKLDDRPSYSSGVALRDGKTTQLVFLTAKGVRSFSPDGELWWEYALVDRLNESSTTPVRVGDMLLASSVTFGSAGLEMGMKDGKPTAKEAWKNKDLPCYFSTPIAVGKEHVYMVTGRALTLKPTSTLRCVEMKTGKVTWSKPDVGKYHAAMLRTGDDKLLMLSDLGDLVLIDPSPKEYKELARSSVVKKEQVWAHPALSDGRVYLRDDKELICVQMPE